MVRLGLVFGGLLLVFAACVRSPAETGETGDSGETGQPDTDTGPRFCEGEEATVTLGTGTSEYVPLDDGSDHTMIYGPQGGWHFLGGADLDNLDDIVELTFRGVWGATGEEVCYGYYRVLSVCEATCDCSYWDMYCYIDVSELASNPQELDPFELLADEPVTLSLLVVDQDGREAYDELTIVAQPDPANLGGTDTGDTGSDDDTGTVRG